MDGWREDEGDVDGVKHLICIPFRSPSAEEAQIYRSPISVSSSSSFVVHDKHIYGNYLKAAVCFQSTTLLFGPHLCSTETDCLGSRVREDFGESGM